MEPSKVYFTDFRAKPGMNLLQKLKRLIKQAGIETIDFNRGSWETISVNYLLLSLEYLSLLPN